MLAEGGTAALAASSSHRGEAVLSASASRVAWAARQLDLHSRTTKLFARCYRHRSGENRCEQEATVEAAEGIL